MIGEAGVEATTVADVARRAESSVGAFYARFPDKDALLRCVAERFYHQAVDTVESVLEPARWDGHTLREVVESCVAFLVQIFHGRRRLIRAVSLRASRDAGLSRLGERLGDVVSDRLLALLAHRGVTLRHPRPEQAVRLAVWLVLAAFHARCMFADDAPAPIPEAGLAPEITQIAFSYFGIEEKTHAS
jgi:AcrR family transcriptional regulator